MWAALLDHNTVSMTEMLVKLMRMQTSLIIETYDLRFSTATAMRMFRTDYTYTIGTLEYQQNFIQASIYTFLHILGCCSNSARIAAMYCSKLSSGPGTC